MSRLAPKIAWFTLDVSIYIPVSLFQVVKANLDSSCQEIIKILTTIQPALNSNCYENIRLETRSYRL
jgi:hypothetical protein